MTDVPPTAQLADAAGISKSYASEIANDKRDPSRPLAIHIFRRTGWRHKTIADLTDEQMAMLETIEPYRSASPTPSECAPAQEAA